MRRLAFLCLFVALYANKANAWMLKEFNDPSAWAAEAGHIYGFDNFDGIAPKGGSIAIQAVTRPFFEVQGTNLTFFDVPPYTDTGTAPVGFLDNKSEPLTINQLTIRFSRPTTSFSGYFMTPTSDGLMIDFNGIEGVFFTSSTSLSFYGFVSDTAYYAINLITYGTDLVFDNFAVGESISPSAIPEPSTLIISLFGGVLLLKRVRKSSSS